MRLVFAEPISAHAIIDGVAHEIEGYDFATEGDY
jgi:hypothetical protein